MRSFIFLTGENKIFLKVIIVGKAQGIPKQ